MKDFYTIKFKIDPELNEGFEEAFRQGEEDWWWYKDFEYEGFVAGGRPNFTNAEFEGFYLNDIKLI